MNIPKLTVDFTSPLEKQLEKLGIENYLNNLREITCLFPHKKTIEDVEDGKEMLGKSPSEAEAYFKEHGRRGLCVHEVLALLRKNPKILKEHYIDLCASRYVSVRVPNVYLGGGGRPRLYWSGSASSDDRWGSPSARSENSALGVDNLESRITSLEEDVKSIRKIIVF